MSEEKDNVIEIEIKDKESANERTEAEASKETSVEEAVSEASNKESAESDYYNQLLRVQAEFQNYKRRTEQRMQEWRANAARDIITKLLPVVDDFDILFDHHKDDSDSVSIKGVKMIYDKLMSTLKDLGLKPIDAAGRSFDPNVHEAVMAEESDAEEGKVLKVWQRGFMFNDSLLRPAKVITAKSKKSGEGDVNEK